ncbi:MAG: hypothetical protein Q9186_007151 [Xanthomendoza sp. 1 TL-2023]
MARGTSFVNSTSSIALALAGKTDSVRIPKPRESIFWNGKESFAAVAAKSLNTGKHAVALPTPPNSISPSLPPHGYNSHATAVPLTPPAIATLDSDLDLQDAVDHAKAQDQPQPAISMIRGLANLDAAGAITPSLLAKHHLPDILLEHGPLAIRHVMGFLTTSVPGFSGIPPAKARRLVVGALESRGDDGGSQEGSEKEIVFEKVGWGRWDARRRGQLPRDRRAEDNPNGLQILGHSSRQDPDGAAYSSRGSVGFSHDSEMEYDNPDVDMLEHEADKMSLDDGDSSSSDSANDVPMQVDDNGDATDEEDWASIGAAALRQASFPLTGGSRIFNNNLYPPRPDPKSRGRGAGPRRTVLARSVPITSYTTTMHPQKRTKPGAQQPSASRTLAGPEADIDINDREAVEALLRLGSM